MFWDDGFTPHAIFQLGSTPLSAIRWYCMSSFYRHRGHMSHSNTPAFGLWFIPRHHQRRSQEQAQKIEDEQTRDIQLAEQAIKHKSWFFFSLFFNYQCLSLVVLHTKKKYCAFWYFKITHIKKSSLLEYSISSFLCNNLLQSAKNYSFLNS